MTVTFSRSIPTLKTALYAAVQHIPITIAHGATYRVYKNRISCLHRYLFVAYPQRNSLFLCQAFLCAGVDPLLIFICTVSVTSWRAVVVNYRTRFSHNAAHEIHSREGHLDNIIVVVVSAIIHLPRYFRSWRFMTCTSEIAVCFVYYTPRNLNITTF